MVRRKHGTTFAKPRVDSRLLSRLIEELRSDSPNPQPLIDEEEFSTGRRRVNVIWDAWADLPLEERTELILQAFQQAEGNAYRESIALANGLTFPEAYAAGMLPHQIIPVLRAGDAVSLEQCYQAMFDEGASKLFDPNKPELRFFSREDAEAAKERLIRRLPQSEQVWVILQEVGRVDDWILR